jgi:TPR repeat protein
MHERGWGAQLSYGDAALWYSRAAAAGNTLAMLHLAAFYQSGGRGVARRPAVADALIVRVKNAGLSPSMLRLGQLFGD